VARASRGDQEGRGGAQPARWLTVGVEEQLGEAGEVAVARIDGDVEAELDEGDQRRRRRCGVPACAGWRRRSGGASRSSWPGQSVEGRSSATDSSVAGDGCAG
jgi:hypothetical protein